MVSNHNTVSLFQVMQQGAQWFPEYEFVFEVNIYRVAAAAWALNNIETRIAAIQPTLRGGRNVDAVDEMAQYEYYQGVAETVQMDALDILQIWLMIYEMLNSVAEVNGRWEVYANNAGHHAQGRLRMMRAWRRADRRAVAIFNYLPRHLFQ